jgi:hypothetical protein
VSNSLVTCSIVAKESLAVLKNMLGFAANVNRDFESEFTGNQARGYSPGQTINIKKPPRFTYRAGRVSVPQSTTETTIPLTLSQGGTDLGFTGLERAVSVQQLDQKIAAAVATVANEIDRQGLDMARLATFNAVGTVGTPPNTQALAMQTITSAQQRLDEMGAPRGKDSRSFILNPAMNGYLVTGMSGMFNAPGVISAQMGTGIVVPSLGLTYAMDQNVVNHVNGAATATNINGAGQTGSSVTVVAVAGGTLTKGTVITLPGVNAVNPQSRQSTGALAQFVVTADVAAGATSIPISPAIVTSGAFQNVTASPTSGSPYVILGAANATYASNVAFHRDAFTLAMVPMDAPMAAGGVDVSVASDQGLSVKVTKYYDPINDFNGMRLDVLFGWCAPYPELATKIVA